MDDAAEPETPHDEQPDVDEALPDRRPRQVETKPKNAARRQLAKALTDELKFDEPSAAAIVRAVDDPDQVLTQLKAPAELGVHGGTLKVVAIRVRNGAVMPIPTNPRVSSRISFPAGGDGPSGGIEPLTMTQKSGSSATIEIASTSSKSLQDAMEIARDYIYGTNDLRESVRTQGVLLPLTIIPVTFNFSDTKQSQTIVCTIDGSSRLTAAMHTWGLESNEVLFDLGNDEALAARRQPILDLMNHDVALLSTDELASLRTQSLPANLIVGFEAYEESLNYPAILDAYLGLLHVEPPQKWGDAAGQDKRADSVLDELERLGRISKDRRRFLAGLMTPAEAEESGFNPSLDGRAAEIFYELDRSRNTRAVNRALRRIGMRGPIRDDRLEVATELAMRPYRRAVNELVRRNPRMALPSAMQRLKPDKSWTPTTASPEELLAGALGEVEEEVDGPAARELAVRAAFWLTRYNALQKSSRTDGRFADELLEDVRGCDHGLRVLAQAILDARAGRHPRQVRPDGSIVSAPDGKELLVDDPWLRKTFVPPAIDHEDPSPDDEDEPTPEWDARDELRDRIYGIRNDVQTLSSKINALDEIEEGGQRIVGVDGVPKDIGDEIDKHLDGARTRILVLKSIWEARNDSGLGT